MSEYCMAEFLVAKWNKRVQVALPRHHFVSDNGKEKQCNTCNISPKLEECCQNKINQSEKLNSISKFIAGVSIICNGYKSHI